MSESIPDEIRSLNGLYLSWPWLSLQSPQNHDGGERVDVVLYSYPDDCEHLKCDNLLQLAQFMWG